MFHSLFSSKNNYSVPFSGFLVWKENILIQCTLVINHMRIPGTTAMLLYIIGTDGSADKKHWSHLCLRKPTCGSSAPVHQRLQAFDGSSPAHILCLFGDIFYFIVSSKAHSGEIPKVSQTSVLDTTLLYSDRTYLFSRTLGPTLWVSTFSLEIRTLFVFGRTLRYLPARAFPVLALVSAFPHCIMVTRTPHYVLLPVILVSSG